MFLSTKRTENLSRYLQDATKEQEMQCLSRGGDDDDEEEDEKVVKSSSYFANIMTLLISKVCLPRGAVSQSVS